MGGFFPGLEYGGPPVSVDNFCTLMSDHNCYILTRDHDLSNSTRYESISEGWNDRGNCKVLYLDDAHFNLKSFKKAILEIEPDVLYLQGVFQSCVFPCLILAKRLGIKVLLAPRGELCTGALNLKKYKKIPYIMLLNMLGLVNSVHFQSTSEEETEAINKWMNVDYTRIHYLENIPSLPKQVYPRRVKAAGSGRFVFISRIHPKKNLLSAINYFKKVIGFAYFDIYGPIEDETYWHECKKAIASLPENVIVNYKGLISHDSVHSVFSQYDCFVFPTLSENYGHVIAESLLVGTPVITSNQTPWTTINELHVGGAFPLQCEDSFIDAINCIINQTNNEFELNSKEVINYCNSKINIKSIKNDFNSCLKVVIDK